MTSSVISFAYFTHYLIEGGWEGMITGYGTDADICKP